MSEDPDGFDLVFGANQRKSDKLQTSFVSDDAAEPIMELPYFLYLKDELESEREYVEQDSIRKYQIDYDETVCMVEKYPEAMHTENMKNMGNSEDTGDCLQAMLPTNTNETEDCLQAMLPTNTN